MSNKKQYFASDKLKEFERDEEQIRNILGDNYYEHYHNKYQRDADFEGIMISIVSVALLAMFCSCIFG